MRKSFFMYMCKLSEADHYFMDILTKPLALHELYIKVTYLPNQPVQFNQPEAFNFKMFTSRFNLIWFHS